MEQRKVKVVMLSTEKNSRIYCTETDYGNFKLQKILRFNEFQEIGQMHFQFPTKCYPQELHIISEDKLSSGDWAFFSDSNNQFVDRFQEGIKYSTVVRKIIASTNTALELPLLTNEFIVEYVVSSYKKKVINEVLIEYDWIKKPLGSLEVWDSMSEKVPIIINNCLIVKMSKTNWTNEEVIEITRLAYYKGRADEYEVTQFVPDGKKTCKFVHPLECFEEWKKEKLL